MSEEEEGALQEPQVESQKPKSGGEARNFFEEKKGLLIESSDPQTPVTEQPQQQTPATENEKSDLL